MNTHGFFRDEDIQKIKDRKGLSFDTINANNMLNTVQLFCKHFYMEGKPYLLDMSHHPKYNKKDGNIYITALLNAFDIKKLSFITITGEVIELTADEAFKFKVIIANYTL